MATAKKGKKIAETSATQASTKVKPSTDGKAKSIGEAILQANQTTSTEVNKTLQSQGPFGPKRVPPKPFAATMVKDWYNLTLKNKDEETYSRVNGCFRALQSNDLKAANYWLTQVEQIILKQREQLQAQSVQLRRTKNLITTLCQHSSTSR